jgi:REP element-mobilizing transposase RayT/DNA-directed RNA polymerase specialized sigma24 family protein
MPRRPRNDLPFRFYHPRNRGLSRRTVFETRRDVRFFLSLVARAVRAGWIEVHAYAIMPNHFHLLIRSLVPGGMALAMQFIEANYTRYFNRTRERDGPLFRGRYGSDEVDDYRYWLSVVGYIDQNPVRAGLVERATDYPFGSAWFYGRGRGPKRLTRDRVVAAHKWITGREPGDPREYEATFAAFTRPVHVRRIERTLRPGPREPDRLDDLLSLSVPEVREWLRSRARLADGSRTTQILAEADTLIEIAARVAPAERNLLAGLLRTTGGFGNREIAARLGIAVSTAHRRVRLHRNRLTTDSTYADLAARIVREAMDRDHPPLPPVEK